MFVRYQAAQKCLYLTCSLFRQLIGIGYRRRNVEHYLMMTDENDVNPISEVVGRRLASISRIISTDKITVSPRRSSSQIELDSDPVNMSSRTGCGIDVADRYGSVRRVLRRACVIKLVSSCHPCRVYTSVMLTLSLIHI